MQGIGNPVGTLSAAQIRAEIPEREKELAELKEQRGAILASDARDAIAGHDARILAVEQRLRDLEAVLPEVEGREARRGAELTAAEALLPEFCRLQALDMQHRGRIADLQRQIAEAQRERFQAVDIERLRGLREQFNAARIAVPWPPSGEPSKGPEAFERAVAWFLAEAERLEPRLSEPSAPAAPEPLPKRLGRALRRAVRPDPVPAG